MFESLPFFQVLVSAILASLFAMVWFSPALFGKTWLESTGLTEEESQGSVFTIVAGLVSSIITFLALAALISYGQAESFVDYTKITLLVWFGFFLMYDLGAVIWGKNKPSFVFVMGGYNLITLFIAAVILFFWQ